MSLDINQVSLYDRGRIVTGGGSGGGGGILPHLIVISETGSTVTATKGQTVITATETSTGHFECDLTELGTWVIDAILGGDDAQVSLVVDTVKVYTVDDSHFHATVTVKYPDGATCRLQSADETLYATGSPYTFTVHHAEIYTITVTYNQRIYTDTVTFTTEGQSFSKTLPSPSEADANDINWWLFFGGVSGTFSTLADILGNSTALSLLMASTDAVDYLVRCTDWASNEGLVPIMTSNTTPSGVVSASSESESGYGAYKAFDGNDATYWIGGASSTGNYQWIKYDFGQAVTVERVCIKVRSNIIKAKIQGSNDDSTWVDLTTLNTYTTETKITDYITNPASYRYYRVYGYVDTSESGKAFALYTVQFYRNKQVVTENQNAMSYIGLNNYCANTLLADSDWCEGIVNSAYVNSVLNIKIPTMTSNTAPSGECFASSYDGGYPAWKAFDGNDASASSQWQSNYNNKTSGEYVGYKFTKNVKIFIAKVIAYSTASVSAYTQTLRIENSLDGNTWSPISNDFDLVMPTQSTSETMQKMINVDVAKDYFRIYLVSATMGARFTIRTLQLYGREDV